MPIFALREQLQVGPLLDHVGRAPFAGDRDVIPKMPPEIVGEILRTPIHLPTAQHVEALMVEQKYAARAIAARCAQRAHIDRVRTAMDRMWPAVIRARRELLRLDNLDQFRVPRICLRVENVNPRTAQPRHQEITPLDMRMGRVRAQSCAARIPVKMMEFVTYPRYFGPSH